MGHAEKLEFRFPFFIRVHDWRGHVGDTAQHPRRARAGSAEGAARGPHTSQRRKLIEPTRSVPMAALGNLLVLELNGGMAGALAGMLLCDQGARVVKVEPPQGARERTHPGHRVWNRGKQSLVVTPEDTAELNEFLARADVLIK